MTAEATTFVETTLRERHEIAEGTMAFHFSKPEGFEFKAGQAIELLIPDPANPGKDFGHAFSIVTAPHEREIVIATRMRDSDYKKALKTLPSGAPVRLDGPFGSLTLHNKRTRVAVFIAGGIGITPFMSMVRHAAHERLPQDIVLIYSNRRPEDAAFLAELQELQKSHPRFRLVATMTEMAKSARRWDGERRMIDAAFVRDAVRDAADPVFYVAGPPAMVEAMRKTLAEAGVDGDDIRSEDFYGY
jgi:ferredoxin-NADP reductase